jgi:lipoprotein-anchoring transpeptidase ErfK/SrfK
MGRTRTSRALIGFTLIAIVIGSIAYFFTPGRTRAKEAERKDQTSGKPAPDKVRATPAAGATTKPAVGDIAATATTKPAPSQLQGLVTTTTPPLVAGAKPDARTAVSVTPPANSKSTAAITKTTGDALADGKSLIDANQLVAGRKLLNDALLSGKLSAADAQAAKELIGKANDTLIFSPRRVADDPYVTSYVVQSGDRPGRIASQHEVTWEFLGRINNVSDSRRLRAGAPIKVVRGPFHAVVSKSAYTLDVYLGSAGEAGSMFVKQFRIGHGRDNSTPTGSWMVTPQNKLKNPKWWGTADEPAREADDPKNPLGEYWIGLTGTGGEAEGKQGFGIHGTIEPETIGKQASHGCVRLLAADIERVYEMLVEGKSTVVIRE